MKLVLMKRKINGLGLLPLALALIIFSFQIIPMASVDAAENITVNVNTVAKDITNSPAGIVSCWLLDSDTAYPRSPSNEEVFADMGIKGVRFPYGQLANNYLWTTPPYENAVQGLTPRVASADENPAYNTNGKWKWCTNPDGTFNKDLDFDEFISMCRGADVEPIICVSIEAHKYTNSVTYAALKTNAVEWVKYANITRNYNVRYWEIGNEQDCEGHVAIFPKSEYQAAYKDFTTAMKAVDPSIQCGPSMMKNWFGDMIEYCPDQVDFVVCHQYLFNQPWTKDLYDGWKAQTGTLIDNVETAQNEINASSKPNTGIYITETSPRGPWADGKGLPDLLRALCFGEMFLNEASTEDVKRSYFWNSHSPWADDPNVDCDENALDINDNSHKPIGLLQKALYTNLKNKLVYADRVSGYVRTYASYSTSTGDLVVFLLNKDNVSTSVNVTLNGYSPTSNYSRNVFTGTGPYDTAPTYTSAGTITLNGSQFSTTLAPISLTIVTFYSISNIGKPVSPAFPITVNTIRSNPSGRLVFIHYALNKTGSLRIGIYTCTGRKIRTLYNGVQNAGERMVKWNGCDAGGKTVGRGIYLVRFETEVGVVNGKILTVK